MSSTISTPTLYDLLQQLKAETFADLRVCLPGSITAVSEEGTVSVQPAIMQVVQMSGIANGLDVPYPQFIGCPVFTLQGGGIGAVMPIEVGDECLIVFSDRALDNWIQTGTAAPLPSVRMHDMSDGFVLVGLNSMSNPIDSPLLSFEGGICETQNPMGAKVAVNSATGLVTVANGTKNLAVILGLLMTYLTALNGLLAAMTTGSIASGATQTAITGLLTQITAITADLAQLLY